VRRQRAWQRRPRKRRRPGCDQLTSTWAALTGADPGNLEQPGRDRTDQGGQLGGELVGLGLQGLDALRRWSAARARSPGARSERAGRARRLAQRWIWVAVLAGAQLGAQLLRGAHDQRLELPRWRPPWPGWRSAGWQAARAAPPAHRDAALLAGAPGQVPRGRGRTASRASLLAPVRRAGRLGRPTSTTRSPRCCRNPARPAP
jgi:hypothetical protein